MTSPQRSLHPASGDDRGTFLSALEFVARGRVQFALIVGAVVGQRLSFEPGPQVLDRIHVRRVRWQEGDLDVPIHATQILAHQAAAMSPQTIPDNQQRLLEVSLDRLEEFDDLFFLDAALVETEQAVGARESSDDRDVSPIEPRFSISPDF